MSSWIQRAGALFGGRDAAAAAALALPRRRPIAVGPRQLATPPIPAGSPLPTPDVDAGFDTDTDTDTAAAFFAWLLDAEVAPALSLQPAEARLLVQLEAALGAEASRSELLPRAPAVIPRLMNGLRDERQSARALADHVAKDPHLVAEVIRLANSSAARAAEPVGDLSEAIGRLGTQGLRRAIARVVLKPIFDARPDSLSGRAAPRLWLHAETQAALCTGLAGSIGFEPFDGYLAGLMHNVGWTALLRALDRAEPGLPMCVGPAFVAALAPLRAAVFARLVTSWRLSDALNALAAELHTGTALGAGASPLGRALAAADREAAARVLLSGPGPRDTGT
jgi:HD-like signal output (HDOD) protein